MDLGGLVPEELAQWLWPRILRRGRLRQSILWPNCWRRLLRILGQLRGELGMVGWLRLGFIHRGIRGRHDIRVKPRLRCDLDVWRLEPDLDAQRLLVRVLYSYRVRFCCRGQRWLVPILHELRRLWRWAWRLPRNPRWRRGVVQHGMGLGGLHWKVQKKRLQWYWWDRMRHLVLEHGHRLWSLGHLRNARLMGERRLSINLLMLITPGYKNQTLATRALAARLSGASSLLSLSLLVLSDALYWRLTLSTSTNRFCTSVSRSILYSSFLCFFINFPAFFRNLIHREKAKIFITFPIVLILQHYYSAIFFVRSWRFN